MPDNADLARRELLATVTRFKRWQRHPDSLAICDALERRLIAEGQALKGNVTGQGNGNVTGNAAPSIDPPLCPDCLKARKANRARVAKHRATKKQGKAKAA